MRAVRRHLWGTLAFAAGLAITGSARVAQAQGSTAKVAAETLFGEGRRLMSEGKASEACPKFAESQRLDPSPSTLLNLASCYEKSDHPASAWATYREAASAASGLGRQDLVATAQRHADSLLPTLPRLTLSVTAPVAGMSVALDGVSVGRAEWGVAVPVDPGDHEVDAVAPRYKTTSLKVTIGKEATTTTVAVPALEAAPPEPTPAPPPAAAATPPPAATPAPAAPPDTGSTGSTQRTVGIVVGVVGVVGLGVGAGFAANAKSQYNASLASCSGSPPDQCTQPGFDTRNSALNSGNAATVLITVGGVALAAGVVLWLTAPSASRPQAASLALVPGVGGGMLRGTF